MSTRRFVLVLVLESGHAECGSDGVLEYCAKSELHPCSGLEVLKGLQNRVSLNIRSGFCADRTGQAPFQGTSSQNAQPRV